MGREKKKSETKCKWDVESLRSAGRNTLAVTTVGDRCADVTALYFIPTEKKKRRLCREVEVLLWLYTKETMNRSEVKMQGFSVSLSWEITFSQEVKSKNKKKVNENLKIGIKKLNLSPFSSRSPLIRSADQVAFGSSTQTLDWSFNSKDSHHHTHLYSNH